VILLSKCALAAEGRNSSCSPESAAAEPALYQRRSEFKVEKEDEIQSILVKVICMITVTTDPLLHCNGTSNAFVSTENSAESVEGAVSVSRRDWNETEYTIIAHA
jgi:hypothetical protein